MSKSSNSSGGIGFVGMLTILFIALKLTGIISWSWLWVLAPVWIAASVGIVFILFMLAVVAYKES